jgi:hypothetical protein
VTYASTTASSTSYTTTATGVAGNTSSTPLALSCKVTNADGPSATASKTVNVWKLPAAPTVTTVKNDGVTTETSVTASTTGHKANAPALPANTSYTWTVTNGSITAGQGTAQITYNAGATVGTNNLVVTCTASNPAGGTTAASASVSVIIPPSGAITVFKGTATNLSYITVNNNGLQAKVTDLGAGATYAWTVTGGTITAGQGTSVVTFTDTATTGSTVTVGVTATNSTGTSTTGSKNLTVVASPSTATLTTAANITEGVASHTISDTALSGATYAWQPTTGVTYASTTASSTSYTTTATGVAGNTSSTPLALSCKVTNADGPSATASKTVNVWKLPAAPTVTTVKNDGVTTETSVTASTTGHKANAPALPANTSYTWTVTNGTITAGQGTAQITYTAGATVGTNNLVVTCTASNPAGGTTPGSASVSVIAVPVATITAAKGANNNLPYVTAANTGISASVASQAGATYAWTITGGTITSATNVNPITFNVTGSGGTTLTLNCTVTNSAGTSTLGSKNLAIAAAPAAATITTNADITYDSTGAVTHALSCNTGTSYTYAWTLSTSDSGHTITPSTSTASSLTYTTASVAGSTLTVSVIRTSADGVASPLATKTVKVDSVPTALPITASSTYAAGTTGNVASVDPTGTTGLTFSWTNSTGISITSGSSTNSLTFTAGASGPGTLVCAISNAAGATAVNSTKSIAINPNATITATTPVTVGSTNAAAVPTQTGVSYTWSIIGGTGASITSGQGTNNITYNAGTGVGNPGLTLQCVVTNTGNATYTSTGSMGIQIVAAPSITSFVNNGPITVGGSANLTATFSNGTGSVDQSVGAVTSAVAKSVSPTATTTYTLTVTNAAGATATQTTTVTVNAGFYAAGNTMAVNRQGHTSTELENGTVLIAGGLNSGVATATADLFTPNATNGTFAATGTMVASRSSHAASRLGNGQVLITGGVNSSGTTINTAEVFNGASFVGTTGAMAVARRGHTSTLLPNGKVLIVGGQDNTNAYLNSMATYDPVASTFTTLGVSLTTARAGHTATLMTNGKVLIFGGLAAGTATATYQVYDPVAGTLTTEASAPGARASHTASVLPDGQVLIYGGVDATGTAVTTAFEYDPNAGAFGTSLNNGGAGFPARKNHIARLLPGGQLLLAGGNNGTADVATADLFDYQLLTTTATGALSATRSNAVASVLNTSIAGYKKVLVSGGLKGGAVTNTAEIFDMALSSTSPTIVLLDASSTSITAGQSINLLPVFLGNSGSIDQGVGAVISGKTYTVTPAGIAGQTVTYTLTVGLTAKQIVITLN